MKKAAKAAKENPKGETKNGAEKDDEMTSKRKRKPPEDGDENGEGITSKRKRKTPEDGEEKPARKCRGKHILSATPCKVWGTPAKPKANKKLNSDKKGTPKKVKERRKREHKAQQSLVKLRRQKKLLPKALHDLPEPTDESKMILIFLKKKRLNLSCAKA